MNYMPKYIPELPPFPGQLERDSLRRVSLTRRQQQWLKDAIRRTGCTVVGKIMGVSENTVSYLLARYRLRDMRSYSYLDPFPGQLAKGPNGLYILTPEQADWLRRFYPDTDNWTLSAAMGCGATTLLRHARKLGLEKLPRSGNTRRDIRARRETLSKGEAGGYYRTLRGHAPEAALEGAAKWREEHGNVYEWCREHFPEKLEEAHRKSAEARRRILRMERFRVLGGMRQETRLHVPCNRYTRQQINVRYRALMHGYWFYKDCSDAGGERWNIYYDEDTRRNLRFEENSEACGFHFKDGRGL